MPRIFDIVWYSLEVGCGNIRTVPKLTQMANPNVSFEAHDGSTVNAGHHGNLYDR